MSLAAPRPPHVLPWAPPFAVLFGRRRCRARLTRLAGDPFGRWGRCELDRNHDLSDQPSDVDHALEFGAVVLRWPARRGHAAVRPYFDSAAE